MHQTNEFFTALFLWHLFSFCSEKNSEGRFRSSDLWVMSPTRFRCATSLFLCHTSFEEFYVTRSCSLEVEHWSYEPRVEGSIPSRSIFLWSYSVMVITLDSESSDPGSSPGRTSFFHDTKTKSVLEFQKFLTYY